MFVYTSCKLAKYLNILFFLCESISTAPFDPVHSDIWGLVPFPFVTRVTFIRWERPLKLSDRSTTDDNSFLLALFIGKCVLIDGPSIIWLSNVSITF